MRTFNYIIRKVAVDLVFTLLLFMTFSCPNTFRYMHIAPSIYEFLIYRRITLMCTLDIPPIVLYQGRGMFRVIFYNQDYFELIYAATIYCVFPLEIPHYNITLDMQCMMSWCTNANILIKPEETHSDPQLTMIDQISAAFSPFSPQFTSD